MCWIFWNLLYSTSRHFQIALFHQGWRSRVQSRPELLQNSRNLARLVARGVSRNFDYVAKNMHSHFFQIISGNLSQILCSFSKRKPYRVNRRISLRLIEPVEEIIAWRSVQISGMRLELWLECKPRQSEDLISQSSSHLWDLWLVLGKKRLGCDVQRQILVVVLVVHEVVDHLNEFRI